MLVPLLFIAASLQAAKVSPVPSAAAIDSAIRVQVDSGFAGVVVVEYKGRVLLERAYSSASRLDTSSVFWIGSMTKEFTAGVVMKLVDKKLISLKDTVGRFVPGASAETKGITIRQLLTHTSGIDANFAASSHTDRGGAANAILAIPLYAKPGTSYRYNDDDYVLLAAIAEIVSGKKWEMLVNDLLLKPAGMHRTGFWNGPPADWGHKGANGMRSTAGDLLKWIHALRQGRVLTPRQVRAIEGPQIFVRRSRDEDVYYGFGVRVYQKGGRTTEVFHSGSSDEGNTAVVRELANGLTVILLSNAGQHAGTTWSSYVAQHLPIRDR